LVVEDSAFLADFMRRSLEFWGCKVIGPASSVQEATTLIENCRLDGAILDINLGGGRTSFPIADLLRCKRVPFIFLTGYNIFLTDKDDPEVILPEYRSIPTLVKPFDPEQLSRFLLRYFGGMKP